ncbi:MAG TPA: hypothetical protein VJ743_09735, partial [Albitalea sp.]|nr:hypothetical protein [Albitalea sp.]
CDVYSLGVVFYELMCGERPYELKVESAAQLEHAILEVEPRAMSRRGPTEANAQARGTTVKGLARTLSPELDAIALRCLGKQAASRYSSVDALLADIDRWLAGEAVLARAPGAWYRVRKFTARHRLGVALSASAIVSLAVVAGVAVVLGLQAREESARAGAARDFMLSLFKRADQEKARGADITARELLETGRNDVMTRMSKQPRLQAELLDGIAKIQWDMGEYVGADSTFAAAARIHAELGMSREAALARTAQANSLVRIGDMNLAAMALREAKSVPGRPVDDLELNARMNEVEGWIAFAHREPARAKEFFLNSHAQALKAFGPYHLMTIDALRGRFYAERESRDFDAAMRLLRELEETSRKTAGVGAVGMAALARDRADLLLSAGRVAESLDHVLASLPKCVADLGPNHGECRELEYSKVNAMLLMGKAQQALEDLPTLKVIADDDKAPALGSGTSLLILRLASAMRLPDLTAQWYGRVASLVEPGAKSGLSRSFRTKALLTLAEARLRERDPLGAQRWIGQALDLQRRDDGSRQVTRLAALAKSLQGVALLMQGRADEALQATAAGEADMTKLVGPDDLSAALLSLNAAISLNAVGRHNDALAVVKQAEPVVRKAMGVAAPTYLRLQALLGEIERARTGASAAKDAVRSTTAMDFFT